HLRGSDTTWERTEIRIAAPQTHAVPAQEESAASQGHSALTTFYSAAQTIHLRGSGLLPNRLGTRSSSFGISPRRHERVIQTLSVLSLYCGAASSLRDRDETQSFAGCPAKRRFPVEGPWTRRSSNRKKARTTANGRSRRSLNRRQSGPTRNVHRGRATARRFRCTSRAQKSAKSARAGKRVQTAIANRNSRRRTRVGDDDGRSRPRSFVAAFYAVRLRSESA